jgi:hypothetical protein
VGLGIVDVGCVLRGSLKRISNRFEWPGI